MRAVFKTVPVILLLSLASLRAAIPVVEPGNTNVSVLATGGTTPLLSQVHLVTIDTNATGGAVELDFGFATQEAPDGNGLIDSLTLTLLDAVEVSGAVLLVADANGVLYTPSIPGAIQLPPGSITVSSIDLPEIRMGLPGLNVQMAYHLAVRIPSPLWAPQVKLALDLFDYPNGLVSVAWSSNVRFVPDVVPACAPPPLGLSAWWKGELDALDSVDIHHGVLHGGVGLEPGRVGRAFSFDGTDLSYVSVPARVELSPQAGPYPPDGFLGGEISIEAWIHMRSLPSAAEGRRPIVAKDSEYELAVNSAGALLFTVSDSDGSSATAEGGSLTAGTWHHVAGTFRQGQFIRAYVDGSRVDERFAPDISSAASAAPLLMGRRSLASGGSYFRGRVDELAVFHHALTDAGVAGIHAAGISGKCLVPLTLRAERLESGVRLRWLRVAGGAVLEQSETLGQGASWHAASAIPILAGDDYVADVPVAGAAKFYRLRR